MSCCLLWLPSLAPVPLVYPPFPFLPPPPPPAPVSSRHSSTAPPSASTSRQARQISTPFFTSPAAFPFILAEAISTRSFHPRWRHLSTFETRLIFPPHRLRTCVGVRPPREAESAGELNCERPGRMGSRRSLLGDCGSSLSGLRAAIVCESDAGDRASRRGR